MRGRALLLATALLFAAALGARGAEFAGRRLELFAGSASQVVLAELIPRFEAATGATVELHVGGSGSMLSQMTLTGRGDIYLPGSPDFMETALERGLVAPDTVVRLAYLLPAIAVPVGNPKGIHTLADLARPGLRVAMGRPDTVCAGLYGVEVLERAGLGDAVRPNVVAQGESCTKTAELVALGMVDAALGWEVFGSWSRGSVEIVNLRPGEIPRAAYIPAGVANTAREPELAKRFLALLSGEEGRAAYARHGYHVTPPTGEDMEIGGRYELPAAWR